MKTSLNTSIVAPIGVRAVIITSVISLGVFVAHTTPVKAACLGGSTDECDFIVRVSTQQDKNPDLFPTEEHSYSHSYPNAPTQISDLNYTWTSQDNQVFNYLQTSNFNNYDPLGNPAFPTAVYVKNSKNKDYPVEMRLQYGNQTSDGVKKDDGFFFFDLANDINFNHKPEKNEKLPYQFTIRPRNSDDNNNQELTVWLSSKYLPGNAKKVSELLGSGNRNEWIIGGGDPNSGTGYVAYTGGLYQYAKNHSSTGFSLNLDMDLNGKVMNLSTNYALFKIIQEINTGDCQNFVNNGGSGGGCLVEFIDQYTLPVDGPITLAGSGRINGFSLLSEPDPGKYDSSDHDVKDITNLKDKAEYRVQSGLIELSSSGVNSDGYAIDISGITVGFAPKRNDSAVLLNNKRLPMATPEEAIDIYNSGGFVDENNNNSPVKVFDFKMVGNWVDASDGLEVHGDGSYIGYPYLHIADDSIKIPARNILYDQATVLQGDANVNGVINLGSYGTGRASTYGSVVDGVYVHRITHKNYNDKWDGTNGPSLVFSPTCEFGNNVEGVTVKNLRVNNFGDGANSVNKAFNIGLGNTGYSLPGCQSNNPTYINDLTFSDFEVYTNPLSNSTIFHRGTGGGTIENINFYEGNVNNEVKGKVAFHPVNTEFAYFVCGVPDSSTEKTCWNTLGKNGGDGTVKNVTYSGNFAQINNINFPASNMSVQPVPEPLTMLGASTAIAFGALFKRSRRTLR